MIKGDIYDSSFLGIDRVTMSKVASVILREAYPLERLEIEGLLDLIRAAKTCEQYGISVDACLYGLKKFGGNEGFVSAMLPILTSLYRRMGRPELAISAAENYVAQYNARYSVALLTSLAAAYCDIGDYATAKRVADAAYGRKDGAIPRVYAHPKAYGKPS